MRRKTDAWAILSLGGILSYPFAAQAQDQSAQLLSGSQGNDPREIIVRAPGGSTNPESVEEIGRLDIWRDGNPDLLGTLIRESASITLQDAQNNPWQPNLVYRGFVASPLQGQPQGLAVYLDGARFNQPFGDTVGFDLIPDVALREVAIEDTSPTYGLNALGGAMVIETAAGRSNPGLEGAVSYGRYDQIDAALSFGASDGPLSYFGAVQYREEDGWRDFSPSDLVNVYGDVGYDLDGGGLHTKFIFADTDLTGNGVAPIELLEARRRSVFTWPDRSRSHYYRISAHPWVDLGENTRFEATLYVQRLKARTLNGDAADIEPCEDAFGLLCLEGVGDDDDDDDEEEESVLTDASGAPIPDVLGGEDYGVLNRGRLLTRSGGILAQLVDERAFWGGRNRLTVGFSFDTSDSDFATSTELGELTERRNVEGLGPLIVQADGAIAPVRLTAKTDYWGAFLSEHLPLGSGFSARLGLRYNWAKVRLIDRIGIALNGRHTFDRLNPGIALHWSKGSKLALHGGYSETNRVPTPAELSCADEDAPCSLANFFIADPPLEQVIARSWSLGARGAAEPGGWRLNWRIDGFSSENRDDIQFVASDIRGRAFFRNIGKTRRQGFDISLDAQSGGFRAALGYAFIDATYRQPFSASSPANPLADDDGNIAVSKGDRLPGIPKHSGTVSLDYSGAIGSRGFTIGGDVIARSGQVLVGDEANLTPRTSGYALVNLRANVELARGFTLFGQLSNVFDEDYETFGSFSEVDEVELAEAPDASDPRAFGPGAPRRWVIGLKARF